MNKYSYVYMLASDPYGTLYVGVTSDLVRRVWEHRTAVMEGFTKRHAVTRLVWYEMHADIMEAIKREKQIKKWRRNWKVNLVQAENPGWRDLYLDFTAD
ncbi:GIY-YIG nuclease family protein [Massilia atriviolacea]|uniref:GIY-YIG nuclease family protein n=1 Tax=Massilia atriviolacea TaxID=2495579 RepID=A0A430HJ58_9BURK|nr:GIY-YIG nuclease family protein [Massilia atriviolacea]RSZ57564.1 GIY-YIG nuclease family protein [Massilia atriviolacea]